VLGAPRSQESDKRKHLAKRRKTKTAIQRLRVLKKKDLISSNVQMGLNLVLIFHSLFMEEDIPFALGVQMFKQKTAAECVKRDSSTT
jgi:hypothetical protein